MAAEARAHAGLRADEESADPASACAFTNRSMTASVVFAAGGTGGHLVPALAIAAALEERAPDVRVSFVGTSRELDRTLIPAAGYRVYTTSVAPFSRSWRGALGAASMVPATAQARSILRREVASVVVGMGGYPSLPVVAAARLSRVPALIHEANAIPGLANEAAARMTPNIAVSFEETAGLFRGRAPRLVGLPLRDAITRFDRNALRAEALESFGLSPDLSTVLIFGGSLGAARLNEAAIALAARWSAREDRQMIVVAGTRHDADVRARIEPGKLTVRVLPFVQRMELAYAAADVAVCRAGASTVHELAVVGLPAMLVPLPIARRHEQHANARLLVDAGAGILVDDRDATAEHLDAVLSGLLGDAGARARMARAARAVARPDAAEAMASWILSLAGARGA
jgi:UDP-N-acetylglucosamine--N-acetylmuramyl-(pentapeptide) pyrophosphoryl-undecaprenol N-acetylglucosamine transferase